MDAAQQLEVLYAIRYATVLLLLRDEWPTGFWIAARST